MQHSQTLIQQVRHEANQLIKEASDGLAVFQWLDSAGDEGRELCDRVKQLQDIARDLEVALDRREVQLQDEGQKTSSGEELVWKNAKAHIKSCHDIFNKLRELLVDWDAEFEPSRMRTMKLQMKLNLVQKRKIDKLQKKLNWEFIALQVNAQARSQ